MKEQNKIESLKKSALFSSLTSEELHRIRGRISIRSFKKNETILHEENTNEYIYVILEGEAKVIQTTPKGKEIVITTHHSGEFFGELSLIDGKTVPAAVCATKDCVTAIISKGEFYFLLFNQDHFLNNMLHILCSRLRESMMKIQMLNFSNASQRIKMLFLMLSETYGDQTTKGMMLKIRLSHQAIANMAGLTRETVTRVLDKWQKSGEITVLKNKHILFRTAIKSITQ